MYQIPRVLTRKYAEQRCMKFSSRDILFTAARMLTTIKHATSNIPNCVSSSSEQDYQNHTAEEK